MVPAGPLAVPPAGSPAQRNILWPSHFSPATRHVRCALAVANFTSWRCRVTAVPMVPGGPFFVSWWWYLQYCDGVNGRWAITTLRSYVQLLLNFMLENVACLINIYFSSIVVVAHLHLLLSRSSWLLDEMHRHLFAITNEDMYAWTRQNKHGARQPIVTQTRLFAILKLYSSIWSIVRYYIET